MYSNLAHIVASGRGLMKQNTFAGNQDHYDHLSAVPNALHHASTHEKCCGRFGVAGCVLALAAGYLVGQVQIDSPILVGRYGGAAQVQMQTIAQDMGEAMGVSQMQLPTIRPSHYHAWPAAKKLVYAMDEQISVQFKWNDYPPWHAEMRKYFAEDFVYDLSFRRKGAKLIDGESFQPTDEPDTGVYSGLRPWFRGEHIPWNLALPHAQFEGGVGLIFAGYEGKVTLTGWANAAFVGPVKGIPHTPTKTLAATMRNAGKDPTLPLFVGTVDLDFYATGPDPNSNNGLRIMKNWCMMDLYWLGFQTGRDLKLIVGPNPERVTKGTWYPPRTTSGLPAPTSEVVDPALTERNNAEIKAKVLQFFRTSDVMNKGKLMSEGREVEVDAKIANNLFAHDVIMYGNPEPVGSVNNAADIVMQIMEPLFFAPFEEGARNLEFSEDQIFCEGNFCGAHGYVSGVMPKGGKFMGYEVVEQKIIAIRFGAHFNLDEEGKFKDVWCQIDTVSAFDSIDRDIIGELQAIE